VLLDLLKEFLNVLIAMFTYAKQKMLIKVVLLKVFYILSILGTNKRKSLSYLFTSSLATSKYTIVILPLVRLKVNILQRTQDFSIPYSIFKESNTFSTLTLVSLKTIVTNNYFRTLLNSLIISNKLNKIIFNKCYLLITLSSY